METNNKITIKTILFSVLVFCFNIGYSQKIDSTRVDYSPYGYGLERLSFGMKQLASHGEATQITYYDLNFVDRRIQDFMRDNLHMVIKQTPKFYKQNGVEFLIVKYFPEASIGITNPGFIQFKYLLFENHFKNAIIKSCKITGDFNMLINFYASYWPTNMHINPGPKDEVAYTYLMQDKISFALTPKNHQGEINISNTTLKTNSDYENSLKNALKDNNNTPKL